LAVAHAEQPESRTNPVQTVERNGEDLERPHEPPAMHRERPVEEDSQGALEPEQPQIDQLAKQLAGGLELSETLADQMLLAGCQWGSIELRRLRRRGDKGVHGTTPRELGLLTMRRAR
jgi:hypothetical protein